MAGGLKNYLSFFFTHNTFRNFLYFFLISASLWFLSRLSDVYTYQLKIPVIYYDQDNKAYPPSFNKDTLKIEVETTGFQLLKINLKKPKLQYRIKEKNKQEWMPQEVQYEIKKLLGKKINIIKISPKKIDLNHKNISQKRVKIVSNVRLKFAPGYKNTDAPSISPSQIIIFGEQEKLNRIKQIKTKPYSFSNVHSNLKEKLKLDLPQGIKSSTEDILYEVPVDQIIEQEESLPIIIDKNTGHSQFMALPKKALLRYSFFKKNYQHIKKSSLQIGLNEKELNKGKNKVKLELKNMPPDIINYQIIPSEATILIKEKNND